MHTLLSQFILSSFLGAENENSHKESTDHRVVLFVSWMKFIGVVQDNSDFSGEEKDKNSSSLVRSRKNNCQWQWRQDSCWVISVFSMSFVTRSPPCAWWGGTVCGVPRGYVWCGVVWFFVCFFFHRVRVIGRESKTWSELQVPSR